MHNNTRLEIRLLYAHINSVSKGIFPCSFFYNKKCNILDFYSELTKKQAEKIRSKCPYYKNQCTFPTKRYSKEDIIF